MRNFFYRIASVLILVLASSGITAAAAAPAMTAKDKKVPIHRPAGLGTEDNLRGVYYSTTEQSPPIPVGRLAVLLLEKGGGSRPTDLHHRFHTGESFRFIISSNRDGWLYILHRPPRGEPQLLWPRVNSGENMTRLDRNRVQAGQELRVPSSPGRFVFDDEVGNEYFYVVIRPTRRPPELTAMGGPPPSGSGDPVETTSGAGAKETNTEKPAEDRPQRPMGGQKIVQFSVRGAKDSIRGVVYDPGPQDADPHTYFSSLADDGSEDIVFEFKLIHDR